MYQLIATQYKPSLIPLWGHREISLRSKAPRSAARDSAERNGRRSPREDSESLDSSEAEKFQFKRKLDEENPSKKSSPKYHLYHLD